MHDLTADPLPHPLPEVFRYQRITLGYGLLSHRTARELFESLAANHELPTP